MKSFPAFLLISFLCFSIGIAEAGEQTTLSPDSGHSNQNQINEALENGNVYLEAGVYEVDGPIYIGSDRVLTGDKDAIIRVWSGSSQWFVGLKGVISCRGVVQNVEISNIQIDGNIGNLPSSYADSRSDTDHDCEKLIILHGYSNQFAKNIKLHDLKLYNSFSDGIYLLFCENIEVYNNFISNCQHEGFYLSCVNYGLVYGNKIAGICSDCGRLDNCQYCKVYDNYFFSYNGESYGQYKGGQAGLQVADSGSSHGYNAANKPQKTDNIEITNNTFASPGRQAIWLHNYNGNVYVHQNTFVDAEILETMGIPIGDISDENQPSVEMSEKVFSSLFDILDRNFTFKYLNIKTKINASVDITDYNNSYNPHSLVYVNGTGLTSVKYEYNGRSCTRYFTIYEGNTTSETTLWKGDLQHRGEALFLEGNFDESKLSVTCYNSKGYQKITNFNVTEVTDNSELVLNPALWSFVGTLAILGISIFRNLRRVIKW